jgi:hypothetical protein
MDRRLLLSGLVGVLGLAVVFAGVNAAFSGQNKVMKTWGRGAMNTIAGTGSLSGTVKAPKEFKAAKVYAKNVDKNVVYMVFTEDGRYQAVDLFPGNYEVSVSKNSFDGGDVQKVTVTAGANATADLTLKEGTYRPNQQMRGGLPKNEPLVAYDELYPAGHADRWRLCSRAFGNALDNDPGADQAISKRVAGGSRESSKKKEGSCRERRR